MAQLLVTLSAAIMLLLGILHVFHTFVGPGLQPTDTATQTAMARSHLGLTSATSVLRAWVGFNASHGMGVILFALVFGYLALALPEVLFGSGFLLFVGFAMLAGWTVLAKLYWFRIPLAGVVIASGCYVAGALIGTDLFRSLLH